MTEHSAPDEGVDVAPARSTKDKVADILSAAQRMQQALAVLADVMGEITEILLEEAPDVGEH